MASLTRPVNETGIYTFDPWWGYRFSFHDLRELGWIEVIRRVREKYPEEAVNHPIQMNYIPQRLTSASQTVLDAEKPKADKDDIAAMQHMKDIANHEVCKGLKVHICSYKESPTPMKLVEQKLVLPSLKTATAPVPMMPPTPQPTLAPAFFFNGQGIFAVGTASPAGGGMFVPIGYYPQWH